MDLGLNVCGVLDLEFCYSHGSILVVLYKLIEERPYRCWANVTFNGFAPFNVQSNKLFLVSHSHSLPAGVGNILVKKRGLA